MTACSNALLLQAGIEAFYRGDDEALLALLTEEVEPLEIVEAGDTVLARARFDARGAGSGIELGVETYVVYRFEGGLVRRAESWRRREDAERSSGLRFE